MLPTRVSFSANGTLEDYTEHLCRRKKGVFYRERERASKRQSNPMKHMLLSAHIISTDSQ